MLWGQQVMQGDYKELTYGLVTIWCLFALALVLVISFIRWQKIRRKAKRYDAMMAGLPIGLLQIGRHGTIAFANPWACCLFGLDERQVIGKPTSAFLSSLSPEEQLSCGGAAYHDISFLSQSTWHGGRFLLQARHRDGTVYPIEVRRVITRLGDGHDVLWTITDASELYRLSQNERRLHISQSFADIGTWDWSVDTEKLYWSPEVFAMFGFSVGEVEPSYSLFCRMVHPDDREIVRQGEIACINGEQRHDVDYRVIGRDGVTRWLRETGNIIHDTKGRPVRMMGIVRDITAQKESELLL